MERVLKFRAWDKFNQCFWYSDKYRTLADFFAAMQLLIDAGNGLVFQQYSGLGDKIGNRIYEGDIYRTWYSRDLSGKDIIEVIEVVQYEIEPHNRTAGCEILFHNNAEIIGNIYENPELLNSDTTDTTERRNDADSSNPS